MKHVRLQGETTTVYTVAYVLEDWNEVPVPEVTDD